MKKHLHTIKLATYLGSIAIAAAINTGYASATSNSITIESYTANPSLTQGSLQMGGKINLEHKINKHLYVDAGVASAGQHAYNLSSDIGLTSTYRRLSPFVELEYSYSHSRQQHSSQLDYDFGVAYHLTKHIIPVVGFDSIGLRANDAAKVGVTVILPHHLSVGADIVKYLKHNGSGAQLSLSYAF